MNPGQAWSLPRVRMRFIVRPHHAAFWRIEQRPDEL